MINKTQLRLIAKSKFIIDKSFKDQVIANNVFTFVKYREASKVFIYLSLDDEVSTDSIIEKSFSEGKRVFVPVVKGDKMCAVEIYPTTQMILGVFGIREPQTYSFEPQSPIIDIAIIPMVAGDKQLNRLGQGGGYYDKWLAENNIFKLGICYDERVFDSIPSFDHDIKMDTIITDKTIYKKE